MGKIIGKWFKASEFLCGCGCGKNAMRVELIQLLDKTRSHLKTGIRVNSAYRCPEHNDAIKGRSSSLHLPYRKCSYAADVTFAEPYVRSNRENILRLYLALESFARPLSVGLGLYGGPSPFVHVDVRGLRAMPAARWSEGWSWPKIN